jgi:hypothetical protein
MQRTVLLATCIALDEVNPPVRKHLGIVVLVAQQAPVIAAGACVWSRVYAQLEPEPVKVIGDKLHAVVFVRCGRGELVHIHLHVVVCKARC